MSPTWITICDTCKRKDDGTEPQERQPGLAFAAFIEAASADSPHVKTRRVSCLMGCKHGCNVAIQAPGKLSYTLGDFAPDAEAAAGVVAYAEAHAASPTGQVPFKEWPQAVKGHFITRHPPLPAEE